MPPPTNFTHSLVEVLATAPENVIEEADWDFYDEDPVRAGVLGERHYAEWRATGTVQGVTFKYLAPGQTPGLAFAHGVFSGLLQLTSPKEPVEGWRLPEDLRRRSSAAIDRYLCLVRRHRRKAET